MPWRPAARNPTRRRSGLLGYAWSGVAVLRNRGGHANPTYALLWSPCSAARAAYVPRAWHLCGTVNWIPAWSRSCASRSERRRDDVVRRSTGLASGDRGLRFIMYVGGGWRGRGGVPWWCCPGDGKRGNPGAAAQHRSRGRQSEASPGMVDRSSKRQEWGQDASEVADDTPLRHGGLTSQASRMARMRPSRAFLRSLAGINDHPGHRAQPERPASPPWPSRPTACEAKGVA